MAKHIEDATDIFAVSKEQKDGHIVATGDGRHSHQEIWQGDAIKLLRKKVEAKSIDVVVTSPPFNIGVKYNKYNDDLPLRHYLRWIGKVAKAIARVLKDDGSFFFNVGSSPTKPWNAFYVAERVCNYFLLQNNIVWVKSIDVHGTTYGHFKPVPGKRFLNNTYEHIFHFTKKGTTMLDRQGAGVPYVDESNIKRWKSAGLTRCRGNAWYIPYETILDKQQRGMHPAIFPQKLPELCIRLHGIEKTQMVLDPFCGIGTTLLAARELDINALGIEIDEKYIERGRRRITTG